MRKSARIKQNCAAPVRSMLHHIFTLSSLCILLWRTPALAVHAYSANADPLITSEVRVAFERARNQADSEVTAKLESLARRYPDHFEIALHLAWARYQQNHPQALSTVEALVDRAPNHPDTLHLLFLLHLRAENLGKSQEAFHRLSQAAAESDQSRVNSWLQRGAKALNQLADRLILQEQEVQSLDLQAEALDGQQQRTQAIDGARNEPVVQYHFGLSLYEEGRFEDALKAFRASTALVRSDEALLMVGLTLEALGQSVESAQSFERLSRSSDPLYRAKALSALEGLKARAAERATWVFDALGGWDSNTSFLLDRTAPDEPNSEGVGQFTLRRDQQIWRRGEQRLVVSGDGAYWQSYVNRSSSSLHLRGELYHQLRRHRSERTFTVSPSLQTYGDRILSQEVSLGGSWSWITPNSLHFDLEPKVYGRYAAAEEEAHRRGWGGELSTALGWYRVRSSQQIAVRAQFTLRRNESQPYRLTRGNETEQWDASAWLLGPRFRLFWRPTGSHSLLVDLSLTREFFDEPERLERMLGGENGVWSKERSDASTRVRVQLSQQLWQQLSVLARADLFGRESTVGAQLGDEIDRRLARSYFGIGLRWRRDGP